MYFLLAALMVLVAVSCKKDKPGNKIPEGAVDLGMMMTREDGTTYKLYWAKSNLCESGLCANPEDYGDYYAWGEVEPYYEAGHSRDIPCDSWRNGKTGYNWLSYKFRTSGDAYDNVKFSKYNTQESRGDVDNIVELQRGRNDDETVDDMAYAKLGGKWRIPTAAEWAALYKLCKWEGITINGVKGQLGTADNGNSIFFSIAGRWSDTGLIATNTHGFYWSSSLDTSSPNQAWDYVFVSGGLGGGDGYRYYGLSVRPVWEE